MQLLASRPNVSNTRRMKVVNFGKVCVSSVTTTKHQGKCRKRTRHLKNNIAIVRNNPKLGCVSQDVELPEQTVGPANVRQSFVKKSGKRSPESASRTQIHENWGKNHQHSGTSGTFPWKLSTVDRNIIEIPTRPLLPTEIQTTRCGQKMVPEKQFDNGPRSC